MARLSLLLAGLVLISAVAEAQAYSPPPPPYYSPPKQSPGQEKKSPPPPPKESPGQEKKYSPPPPSPVYSPPPPPVVTPPPPSPSYSPPVQSPPPPSPVYSPPPPVVDPPPPSPVYSPPPSPIVTPPTPTPAQSPPPSPIYSPPPPVVTPPPPSPEYSPPPPVVTTPPPSGSAAKKVRCHNKEYTHCYYREFTCPAACPQTCEVDCETCSPVCNCNKPGAVCQDPRFIGADGITFYFHGKKDQDFCLVTDPNLHINAHFIGKRNPTMGRDFTWVQSLGILFDDHEIYVGARTTATWNDAIDRLDLSVDGRPVLLPESQGASWQHAPAGVHIRRSQDVNVVIIEAEGKFKIKAVVVPITKKESLVHNYEITDDDCFAHLDLSFKFYLLSGQVSGVLGQTYASNYVSKVNVGVAMPVVGGERKFLTSSLFATDCGVSRFVGSESNDAINNVQFADLKCASGINGRGVVCKR